MYRFLLTADSDPRPSDMWSHANTMRVARSHIKRKSTQLANPIQKITTAVDSAVVEAHWEHIFNEGERHAKAKGQELNNSHVEKEYVENELTDVFPWPERELFDAQPARNVRVRTIESRLGALNGSTSPFLESGFHFRSNPDITIYDGDQNVSRLNIVNLVMAHHGLSEMGDGGAKSHDQHYITTGEYINRIYPKTEEERAEIQAREEAILQSMVDFDTQETFGKIEEVLVQKAYEWANSSDDAPRTIQMKAKAAQSLKKFSSD
jgi:hypothetical protein